MRQALSSGSQIAVTPLSIFDDVKSIAYYFNGCTVEDISSGIRDYFFKRDKVFRKHLTKLQYQSTLWREQHSFVKIASRLEGMIESLHIN